MIAFPGKALLLAIAASLLIAPKPALAQFEVGPGSQSSVDCSAAVAGSSEQIICEFAHLSTLERQVEAAFYGIADRAGPADWAGIQPAHDAYLNQRAACGTNSLCIRDVMARRGQVLWPVYQRLYPEHAATTDPFAFHRQPLNAAASGPVPEAVLPPPPTPIQPRPEPAPEVFGGWTGDGQPQNAVPPGSVYTIVPVPGANTSPPEPQFAPQVGQPTSTRFASYQCNDGFRFSIRYETVGRNTTANIIPPDGSPEFPLQETTPGTAYQFSNGVVTIQVVGGLLDLSQGGNKTNCFQQGG